MKKLLLCTLTSALFFATISAQDDSKIQESVEKLHALVAQVEDQLKHINEKLNVVQSGNETTTSKLTEVLSQLGQIATHISQPKTDQPSTSTTPIQAIEQSASNNMPTPKLPEPAAPIIEPSTTTIGETQAQESSTFETPEPAEEQIEKPQEPTLLADIGTEQNMENEQPQEISTESGIVNTEATIL